MSQIYSQEPTEAKFPLTNGSLFVHLMNPSSGDGKRGTLVIFQCYFSTSFFSSIHAYSCVSFVCLETNINKSSKNDVPNMYNVLYVYTAFLRIRRPPVEDCLPL